MADTKGISIGLLDSLLFFSIGIIQFLIPQNKNVPLSPLLFSCVCLFPADFPHGIETDLDILSSMGKCKAGQSG